MRNFCRLLLPALFVCWPGAKPASAQNNPPKPFGPVPSAAQLRWHEMEMYVLVHFTPTTFENKEWGYGDADPEIFNPKAFDADQIATAVRAGGFRGLISVAKHHDGFALWPTKTNNYNIKASPWRDGKGDMVMEFMRATRKAGMQFGVYCSAWDRNDPAYGTPAYVSHYREQLSELYTRYGELFTSWHDGANGGDGYYGGARETRKIDRATYYEWEKLWQTTRQLQPGAVIFSDIGPDVRWVGNERGAAGETCWATFTPVGPDGSKPAPGHVVETFLTSGQRDGKFWIPAECDVPHRKGWFYHADQDDQVKTPDQLFAIYLQSVGRGANLSLGIAPMPDGRLHAHDVASLRAFGEKLRKTFSTNLAAGATLLTAQSRPGNAYRPENLLDGDRYSYWAPPDYVHNPVLEVALKGQKRFDLIRLRENIKLGQRLDSVKVEIQRDGGWKALATATSIGSTRLIKLKAPVQAERLRLKLYAPVAPTLSDLALFLEAPGEQMTYLKETTGLDRSAWQILSPASGDSRNALDGNKNTTWLTASGALPVQIVFDLGKQTVFSAFSYLPRQDGAAMGLAERYELETSQDGKEWTIQAAGEFSNIRANPVQQFVRLTRPANCRFLRFTVRSTTQNNNEDRLSIAEFDLYK
ncbi:alpha-L-fucosidase [Pedobacter yulinensis]|uniref:alpha-L-fucosidase n=1 Tax=Pedobacter yulinensis TaxID=2126353 RepID=A0A2T3HKT9_9SPHI|nr:alpha-L-fucosidase [Pedobacter yulinensis]PST83023.1 alpha-L-fucosidase [Pedobacter yulinensis]